MDRNQSGYRKKLEKLENKGFTLIELLVTIAILSVVGGIVVMFLQSSTKSYQSTSKEVDMQYEAQVLLNQLEGYVIGANLGLSQEDHTVYIMNKDEKGVSYDQLTWNPEDKKLYYEKKKESNGLEKIVADQTVLAENVEQFSMDVSKAQLEGKVKAEVELVKDEKSYKAKATWKLRNTVLSARDAERTYKIEKEKVNSQVTEVVVYASRDILIPGEDQVFYARVNGRSGTPSQSVVWALGEGATSPGTYMEENGTLHTGTDESAKELTIVAQSVEKPSVKGELKIQMDPGGIEITPRDSWVGVTGGIQDPHSYGNNKADLQVKIKENQEVDLSTLSWICDRDTYETRLQNQPDPVNKTVEILSTESGGDIVIQVFAKNAEGKTIRSNQAVIHVVGMTANRKSVTSEKKYSGSVLTISDGLKELKAGDIQYANSLEDILYNRKNCRFYLYDPKGHMSFSWLKKSSNGAWSVTTYYDKKFSVWEVMFKDPLSAYGAPGLYKAGEAAKKKDVVGDSFYFGFSHYEIKIEK